MGCNQSLFYFGLLGEVLISVCLFLFLPQMDELITKCTQLEALCKSRRAEAWQRSQDYLTFQEKYNSVSPH